MGWIYMVAPFPCRCGWMKDIKFCNFCKSVCVHVCTIMHSLIFTGKGGTPAQSSRHLVHWVWQVGSSSTSPLPFLFMFSFPVFSTQGRGTVSLARKAKWYISLSTIWWNTANFKWRSTHPYNWYCVSYCECVESSNTSKLWYLVLGSVVILSLDFFDNIFPFLLPLPPPPPLYSYDGIKHIKVVQDGEKYGFSVPCQFLSLLELVLYYSDISLETHNPVLTTTLAYPINTT